MNLKTIGLAFSFLVSSFAYGNELKCEILPTDKVIDRSSVVDGEFSINLEKSYRLRAGALFACIKEGKLITYWEVFGDLTRSNIKVVESFSKISGSCNQKDQTFYADRKRSCEEARAVAISKCIEAGFHLSQCSIFSQSYYDVQAPGHSWGGRYCAINVVGSCN